MVHFQNLASTPYISNFYSAFFRALFRALEIATGVLEKKPAKSIFSVDCVTKRNGEKIFFSENSTLDEHMIVVQSLLLPNFYPFPLLLRK
jgi:hypothetical protein